jgi:hypothetical protein
LGPGRACKMRAQVRLWLLRAWPGKWGLDCGLIPKIRPGQAWAFCLCSKSSSPHVRLAPWPNPSLFQITKSSKKGAHRLRGCLLLKFSNLMPMAYNVSILNTAQKHM